MEGNRGRRKEQGLGDLVGRLSCRHHGDNLALASSQAAVDTGTLVSLADRNGLDETLYPANQSVYLECHGFRLGSLPHAKEHGDCDLLHVDLQASRPLAEHLCALSKNHAQGTAQFFNPLDNV